MNKVKTIFSNDLNHVFLEASGEINAFLTKALEKGSRINIGFCGGRSIVQLLGILEKNASSEIWQKSNFFLVDERAVELSSPDSNYKLLNEELFSKLIANQVINSKQIHPFIVDNNSADFGLAEYNKIFQENGGSFDLIFLGVGEDGHIASLFPGHPNLKNTDQKYFLITDSPKPPPIRISISKQLIAQTPLVVILFIGEAKRSAYENFNNPHIKEEDCPAKIALSAKNLLLLSDLHD